MIAIRGLATLLLRLPLILAASWGQQRALKQAEKKTMTIGERFYVGYRTAGGADVFVNGATLPQTEIARQHSPLGYEWGYNGSGPAALAHAILSYELREKYGTEGAEELADEMYQYFKEKVIANMPRNDAGDGRQWVLTQTAIQEWVEAYIALANDAGRLTIALDDIWTF